jgi:heterodisulfide reductase subunit C
MGTRVDPSLMSELKEYGAVSVEKCFNCGNCTAICPLTSSEHPFPRKTIRMVQMGLRDQLVASIDPWLCYSAEIVRSRVPGGAGRNHDGDPPLAYRPVRRHRQG